jgi:competence protein ComEA
VATNGSNHLLIEHVIKERNMELKRYFPALCLALALGATNPAWSAPEAVRAAPAAAININTADAETLADALQGVGEARARAIVAYREEHGPFKSPEQLTEVKGIGDSVLEANRGRIRVK